MVIKQNGFESVLIGNVPDKCLLAQKLLQVSCRHTAIIQSSFLGRPNSVRMLSNTTLPGKGFVTDLTTGDQFPIETRILLSIAAFRPALAVIQRPEALRYKPEGRGFDSR
jgi:hypothetical protein